VYIDSLADKLECAETREGVLPKRISSMSSGTRVDKTITLEEFLRLPDIKRPERLPDDGALDGDPVLPGYRLRLAQLFGWLKLRRPNPPDRSGPAGGAPRR
jgi:hypothetical protein